MDKELQVEVIRSSIEAKIRGEKHLIFIEVDTILGFSFRNRQSLQIEGRERLIYELTVIVRNSNDFFQRYIFTG